MAYSSVKKPAFYVPIFDYLQSIGMIEYKNDDLNDIHLLNPAKTHRINPDVQYDIELKKYVHYNDIADSDGYVYIFILGHNLNKIDGMLDIELIEYDTGNILQTTEHIEVVNDNGASSKPTYNGFTILKAKYSAELISGFRINIKGFSSDTDNEIKLGCVSLCSKWNPPHNPDLSLGMTRQYDGVKTTRTKGGATLSNAQFTRGGTFWANGYAWELSGADDDISNAIEMADRNRQKTLGRRIWSMNFSYLTPANLMPEFESLDYYATEYDDNWNKNIHQSDSFFARVLNRVQGSHLPFIFQPNDTDNNTNPDQWAIVRFDQKDFTITQAAPDLYSLSMKLTESW